MATNLDLEKEKEEKAKQINAEATSDRRIKIASWIAATSVSACIIAVTFVVALVAAHECGVCLLTCSILIFSGLLGWVTGMLFSPDNPNEASKFSSLWKGLTVFVSGYVVSKLEPLFNDLPKFVDYLTTLNAVFWVVVLSSLILYLTAAILAYLLRLYAFDCEGNNILPANDTVVVASLKNGDKDSVNAPTP